MKDDRLIDVYDVTTGRLLDKLSQREALKRIRIHERIRPDTKTIENNRYRIDDVLEGYSVAAFNLIYCCTEPESERVPTPVEPITMGTPGDCPSCTGTGLTNFRTGLSWGSNVCGDCGGTGNLD